MSDYIKREDAESGVGYVGIDKDYFVSVKEVLNITAETGALETQARVRELPPADVVEVRHGHWLLDSSGAEFCSECGEYPFDDGEYHISGWSSKYCPNCGAKMDGEEQEHE